ncbi:MAG: hypothetical protein ACON5H_11130 [Akkermansiaceae bacterium]
MRSFVIVIAGICALILDHTFRNREHTPAPKVTEISFREEESFGELVSDSPVSDLSAFDDSWVRFRAHQEFGSPLSDSPLRELSKK